MKSGALHAIIEANQHDKKVQLPQIALDFHLPTSAPGVANEPAYTGKDPAQITVNSRLSKAAAERLFGVVLQTGGTDNTWPSAAQKKGIQEVAFAIGKNSYGWGSDQDGCLVELWNDESGWSSQAYNSATAEGIPQDLMSVHANETNSKFPDFATNPVEQVQWGEEYIHYRYGNPCNANYQWWHQYASDGSHWY